VRLERRELGAAGPAELAASLREGASARNEEIAAAVAETIAAVREGGDRAVLDLGERFDGTRPESLRVGEEALERALGDLDPGLREALEAAAANIRSVAEAQEPSATEVRLPAGQTVSVAEVPVGAAAVYAPGGRAPYPSTVLMGVIPALVAGVARVAVASPPGSNGMPHPTVLAAARIAGTSEVYAMGGAQAVAALAFGTESVPRVDVLAGPGSPWVQEAKLQCSREVGIDGYAGPSELMVICDATAPPAWVALDVGSQAEHGGDGLLVVASSDEATLEAVGTALERLAADRPAIAGAKVTLVATPELGDAVELADAIAPEHLELICRDQDTLAERARTAGCVFVGAAAATAFGDYAAGSNHVLPTGGAGRFTGPLGPATFRRRISRVAIGADAAAALAPTVATIARAEGFDLHADSAEARAVDPGEQAS
jgi:histidinol dehydrogenase